MLTSLDDPAPCKMLLLPPLPWDAGEHTQAHTLQPSTLASLMFYPYFLEQRDALRRRLSLRKLLP